MKNNSCHTGSYHPFFQTWAATPAQQTSTFSRPAANIIETETAYIIELAAPDLTKEDFKIDLEKNNLIISAEKQEVIDKKYTHKEFHYGAFKRSFIIPETVDTQSITAKYEQGVLSVTLPKSEAKKPIVTITVH